jgi:Ca-activated chloride channel family protein
MDTNVIPKGGTNIAAAIATAREAFGKAEGQTRALVILTDGEELDADGIAAAKQAASEGIRIFTVGIGSTVGSLIPMRTQDGRQDFVRDASGKPVNSKLDAARLNEIAQATGGFFVSIGPDAAKEIFQKGIEPMELTENGVFTSRQPIERYQWPLGVAVFCLMLSVLPGDRRRKVPLALAVLTLFFTTTPMSHAGTNGLQDYMAGQFEQAGAAFEKGLQSEPDSRPLQFNAGAAAYKSGKFDQAISHFTKALLSEDKKRREEASYNLANSLVRTGEAAKEKEAKKTAWKSAIEHYSEALKLNPVNKFAKENRDIVDKLLKDLEKQEQQDKKDQKDQKDQKDDQSKDQDKKDQDQKEKSGDQDKNESEKKPEDKKEDEKDLKDSEDKKPQDSKKDESQSDKKNDQKSPAPSPTPGEKKEGDLKNARPEEPKPSPENQKQDQGVAGAEEEKAGQMSPSQARALLNSLRNEEGKVNLMEQQTSQEVLRDW